MSEHVLINENIRAPELRVIGAEGENYGVISKEEALRLTKEAELDLIEISPKARPPVAKIMDYGKFQYTQSKKEKEIKAKSHVTETKNVQVKIGTSQHDMDLKARRVSEWLAEGNRVKIDLFLRGRAKYMDQGFLRERIQRFLVLITVEHKIADAIKKSPKGLSVVIEKGQAKQKEEASEIKEKTDDSIDTSQLSKK